MPVAFPDPRGVECVHKVLITAEQTYYELRKLNHIPPSSLDFCIFISLHFFVAGLFFAFRLSGFDTSSSPFPVVSDSTWSA